MTKTKFGLLFSVFLFSSQAFAVGTPIASNTPIILTDCPLLADDVTLTLSNGVLGVYNCVAAANSVLVATCHSSGRVASRSVDVPCVNTLSTDPAVAATQTQCTDPTVPTNRTTNSGASFFVGNTAGGAIGPLPLGGAANTCTAGNLTSKI